MHERDRQLSLFQDRDCANPRCHNPVPLGRIRYCSDECEAEDGGQGPARHARVRTFAELAALERIAQRSGAPKSLIRYIVDLWDDYKGAA